MRHHAMLDGTGERDDATWLAVSEERHRQANREQRSPRTHCSDQREVA
jgi:hypothetical protein